VPRPAVSRGAFNERAIERGYADKVLRETMEVCGVDRAQRWLIYAGLRAGGWFVWRRYRTAAETRVPAL